jgi:hypothetical protein
MTPGPDRHWFVAIHDVDVGPIDIAEMEARWRTGELGGGSLAWRPGMSEWQTIGLIPELAYLNQLEQALPGPALPDVQWVVGDTNSLSDLVASELEAAETAPAALTTASPISDDQNMGLPDLGSLGFGDEPSRSGQHHWDTGWGLPAPTQPMFAAGPAPWTEGRPDPGKHNLMTVLVGGGFLVLALGLTLAIIELVRGARPAVLQAPPAVAAPVPSLAPMASLALQPVAPAPGPKSPALQPAAPTPEPTPPAVGPVVSSATRPTPEPTLPPKPPRRVISKPQPEPLPPPEPKPKRLTKRDILQGIKRNASNLLPCLRTARAKDEVTTGRIRLVLDWVIEADGTVSRPKLKGPARLLRTSLPPCLTAQMRTWTFPEAGRSSKVRNFGLPINLK